MRLRQSFQMRIAPSRIGLNYFLCMYVYLYVYCIFMYVFEKQEREFLSYVNTFIRK